MQSDTCLFHWGRVTHICVDNLTIIGSYNGLSTGRRQTIIWTNDGILLTEPLRTSFSESLIEFITFSVKEMHMKMSSRKWQPFCLCLNVLIDHHVRHADSIRSTWRLLIASNIQINSKHICTLCQQDISVPYLQTIIGHLGSQVSIYSPPRICNLIINHGLLGRGWVRGSKMAGYMRIKRLNVDESKPRNREYTIQEFWISAARTYTFIYWYLSHYSYQTWDWHVATKSMIWNQMLE